MKESKLALMERVWDSFEWLMKEKLTSIDDMTRRMISEMQIAGAPKKMIADFLPRQFELLKQQVVATQDVYYTKYDLQKERRASPNESRQSRDGLRIPDRLQQRHV